MRKIGLTVDNLNLLSVDLVTADGEQPHVDAETEPELFWGLRGCGGNFGIATALCYRLHPVGPLVLGGPIFWPLAAAPEVLGFVREFANDAPDDLGINVVARLAPPCRSFRQRSTANPFWGSCWSGRATSPRAKG